MAAWAAVQAGQANPLREHVAGDAEFLQYLQEHEIVALMDASGHVGDAPARTRRLAAQIRMRLGEDD